MKPASQEGSSPSRRCSSRTRRHRLADRKPFLRFFNPDQLPIEEPAGPEAPSDLSPAAVALIRSKWRLSNSTFELDFHVWTPEDWVKLDSKPSDVQICPGGYRVALRIA